jgi:hypothetical protein
MRILALQGPLKTNFVTKNVFPAGITSVDIPLALHALLNALENAYKLRYSHIIKNILLKVTDFIISHNLSKP